MQHDAWLLALKIAAAAECDPRSAMKAVRGGPDAVRGRRLRSSIARAMEQLGVNGSPAEAAAQH